MTLNPPTLKLKRCKECREQFFPRRAWQALCSLDCAVKAVCKQQEKKAAQKQREEKRQDRAKREAMKTITELIKEAQVAFNAYIRARDAGMPCICCGRPLGEGDVGGAYDCGHYRSTGSAPHLRFDERNAHAQRKVCNRWGAGRAVDYRIGLLVRIGREAVEALEADCSIRKWTREELRAIKATYVAKLKELRKQETTT